MRLFKSFNTAIRTGAVPCAVLFLLSGRDSFCQLTASKLEMHQGFFVPNAGQWSDHSVAYGLTGRNWSVAAQASQIKILLRRASDDLPLSTASSMAVRDTHALISEPHESNCDATEESTVVFSFPGCNQSTPIGIDAMEGKVNYFVGGSNRRSAAGLATYRSVEYSNLYDGIDLFVSGYETDGSLKYEFHVAPGADPALIRMTYSGLNRSLAIDDQGDLRITTDSGTLIDHAPMAYQTASDGSKRVVRTTYALDGADGCHFALGDDYDRSRPLIIDPDVEWMVYRGGSGTESAICLATDAHDNIFIGGATKSSDFEGHNNTYHGGLHNGDAYIAKLNQDGSLLWMTYVGGSDNDVAQRLAVTEDNGVEFTGFTDSMDFEGRTNKNHGDSQQYDGYIARVDASGSLLWATYIGGISDDLPGGIALNRAGHAFVVGTTSSSDFEGHTNMIRGHRDAFLCEVNPNGQVLQAMFVGGFQYESCSGIVLDANEDAIIAGDTNSDDFEERTNSLHGGSDAYVCKVTPGGAVHWMTYLGSTGDEATMRLGLDDHDNALIVGYTDTTDFEGRLNSFHGSEPFSDGFICKTDPNGDLRWMSYLGGSNIDVAASVTADHAGNALVTGWTISRDFEGRLNEYHGGPTDPYVCELSPEGELRWERYLGGSNADEGLSIVLREPGDALVCGSTLSTDFEGRINAFHGGESDGFVVSLHIANEIQLHVTASCPEGGPIQISWSGATPHGRVSLLFGHTTGETMIPEGNVCAGITVNLRGGVRELFESPSGASGQATIYAEARPGACGGLMQLVDHSTCSVSNPAVIE